MVDGIMGHGEGGGENQERKDTGFLTYYVKLRKIQEPLITDMAHHVLGTREHWSPQAPHNPMYMESSGSSQSYVHGVHTLLTLPCKWSPHAPHTSYRCPTADRTSSSQRRLVIQALPSYHIILLPQL